MMIEELSGELADLLAQPRRIPSPPPGIYFDVEMEAYLLWDSVSASVLGEMMRSAAHGHALVERLETLTPQSTLAQIVGTAGHCAVIEPEEFTSRYARGPAGHWGHNPHKAVVAQLRENNPGVIVLKPFQIDAVERARDAILAHPSAGWIVENATAREVSVVWDDPATGVRCKARPDLLMADHNIIADLKSALDAGRRGFARALSKLGYHRKAAWYVDGMREALRAYPAMSDIMYDHFLFVAFEKVAPFAVAVYHLDPDSVDIGREQCKAMLRLYAECKAADKWPAYPTDITMIAAHEWTRYQLEDMEPHATD